MGHIGSKTRSLGQKLENPCLHSRSHFFSMILMKLGQNGCLNDILDVCKWVMLGQKLSHGQILEKPYKCFRGKVFSLLSNFLNIKEGFSEFQRGKLGVSRGRFYRAISDGHS